MSLNDEKKIDRKLLERCCCITSTSNTLCSLPAARYREIYSPLGNRIGIYPVCILHDECKAIMPYPASRKFTQAEADSNTPFVNIVNKTEVYVHKSLVKHVAGFSYSSEYLPKTSNLIVLKDTTTFNLPASPHIFTIHPPFEVNGEEVNNDEENESPENNTIKISTDSIKVIYADVGNEIDNAPYVMELVNGGTVRIKNDSDELEIIAYLNHTLCEGRCG